MKTEIKNLQEILNMVDKVKHKFEENLKMID